MAEIKKVNKKIINDPLYSAVIRFLKKRIQDLEANGPEEELELARQRYTGIIAGDLTIENPVSFPDGHVRVCFVSRKTGFARVDVDIDRVTIREVLTDFKVKTVEVDTLEDLVAYVRAHKTETEPTLFDMKWRNTFGIKVTQADAKTTKGPQKALGDMFFSSYVIHRQSETFLDPVTLESGTVDISDMGISPVALPLFIHELLVEEVNIPELRTNLPPDFNGRRGEQFKIPMTIWFGDDDITLTAGVELSTAQGYTNPKRSDDLLYLEGQVIYGTADREVRDDIIVRVTHIYNGREVKKTFRMTAIIAPDAVQDLTFVVNPETVEGAQGDRVEFNVTGYFKGAVVEFPVPPAQFEGLENWGLLKYVRTNADKSMTYGGVINGTLLPGQERDGTLYSCEFEHVDAGISHKAKAYLNVIMLAAETAPQFVITKLTDSIMGYKGDKGKIIVEARYGNIDLTVNQLNVKTGPRGPKKLINFDQIYDDHIAYTLLEDSGTDGLTVDDIWQELFAYITPGGVRKNITRDMRVYVKRDSVVVLNPTPAVEKTVTKYQKGGLPFTVLVNGVNKTAEIINVKVTEPKNQIRVIDTKNNTWQCLATEAKDTKTTATWEFEVEYDGSWHKHTYAQPFLVKAWMGKEVVAIPGEMSVTGDNHASSTFSFTLYRDDKVISNRCIRYPADDQIPSNITIQSVVPIAQTELVRISYSRDIPGQETGRIAVTDQTIASPTADQIAWIDITTDITQARILELVSKDDGGKTNVDVAFTTEIKLNFAGQPITLKDPNLTFALEEKSPFRLTDSTEDTITLITNRYEKPGTESRKNINIDFEYNDNGNKVKLRVGIQETIVYPAIQVFNDEPVIEAHIWDSKKFKIRLISGIRDFADNVTKVEIVGEKNKYISVDNSLGWTCFYAEKTRTEGVIVPLKITYRYGTETLESDVVLVDTLFNVDEWDGITFAGFWEPESFSVKSGEKVEAVANFQYLGEKPVEGVTWDKSSSIIPDFVIVDKVEWVAGKGYVISMTTTRGGTGPVNLIFVSPDGKARTTVAIAAEVEWPEALNIVSQDQSIRGYHTDDVPFNLVLNYHGTPVPLNDPKLTVVMTSGTGNPITLKEKQETAFLLTLVKGGEMGKDYTYSVNFKLTYDAGVKTGNQDITLPAVIRVPEVKVGSNPVETVKIWDTGEFKITLVDERGKQIAITSYAARGTGTNAKFVAPKNWEITNASTTAMLEGKIPLSLGFNIGGNPYKLDADVKFNISSWDGKTFKASTDTEEIFGDAGDSEELAFKFEYMGKPITGATLDKQRSTIPDNIIIGDLTEDGKLRYTLKGNGRGVMNLLFVRPGATGTVANVDTSAVSMVVNSRSTTDVLTLVSHDDKAIGNWRQLTDYGFIIKYGEKQLDLTTPGLSYKLKEGDRANVSLGGVKPGNRINLTPLASDGPSTVKDFANTIIVTFDLGQGAIKTLEVPLVTEITTGEATIVDGGLISVKLWDVGTFDHKVKIDGIIISDITTIVPNPQSKYLASKPPKGFEVIAAEPTTSTQTVPVDITYQLDGKPYVIKGEQKLTITGSTQLRFYVNVSPDTLESSIDVEKVLTGYPVFKGQPAPSSKFMQTKSTIPADVTLVSLATNGNTHLLTFKSAKPGLYDMDLVWHSPEAGDNPDPSDVYTVSIQFKVLSENPMLEVKYRQPKIADGVNNLTGQMELQLTFGGAPIATNDPKLSISKKSGVKDNIFNLIGGNTVNSIGYRLAGVLQPGKTVEAKDFLLLRYNYGGVESNTVELEIPIDYTNGPVIAQAIPTIGGVIWNKYTISPKFTCDGIDISEGYIRGAPVDSPHKYMTLEYKTVEIYNAPVPPEPAYDGVVDIQYEGTNRGYTWTTTGTLGLKVAQWDGLTFKGTITPTSKLDAVVGDSISYQIEATYKGQFVSTTIEINELKSDMKGIYGIESILPVPGKWTKIDGKVTKVGEETIQFYVMRPGAPTTGQVLNVDYMILETKIKSKAKELKAIVTGTYSGGNGELVWIGLNVTNGSESIRTDNPALEIALGDETVLKPTGKRTNTAFECLVTGELHGDPNPRVKDILGKFKYTETGTGLVTTTETPFKFNLIRPSDYPILSILESPIVNTATQFRVIGRDRYKVMSGTADITAKAVFVDISSSEWVRPCPEMVDGWWMFWKLPKAGQPAENTNINVTIKVPYRDTEVTLSVVQPIRAMAATASTVYSSITTVPTTIPMSKIGDKAIISLDVTVRGIPKWTAGWAWLTSAWYNDYVKITNRSTVDAKNIVELTCVKDFPTDDKVKEIHIYYNDTYHADEIPKDGKGDPDLTSINNRDSVVTVMTDFVVTATPVSGKVWDKFALNKAVTVKVNGVSTTVDLISIDSPEAQLAVLDKANFQIVKGKPAGETFTAKFNMDYKGYKFSQDVQVTTAPYNNDNFKVEPVGGEIVMRLERYPNGTIKGLTTHQFKSTYKGNPQPSGKTLLDGNKSTTRPIMSFSGLASDTNGSLVTNWGYETTTGKQTADIVFYNLNLSDITKQEVLGEGKFIVTMPVVAYWPDTLYVDSHSPEVHGKRGDIVMIDIDLRLGNTRLDLNHKSLSYRINDTKVRIAAGKSTATQLAVEYLYDNDGPEWSVDIPIEITYDDATAHSQITMNQKFIFNEGANPTGLVVSSIISPKTGQYGYSLNLPFKLTLNGKPVEAAEIKTISGDGKVNGNTVVVCGTMEDITGSGNKDTRFAWYAINPIKGQAPVVPTIFKVVVTRNGRDYTVENVNVNITVDATTWNGHEFYGFQDPMDIKGVVGTTGTFKITAYRKGLPTKGLYYWGGNSPTEGSWGAGSMLLTKPVRSTEDPADWLIPASYVKVKAESNLNNGFNEVPNGGQAEGISMFWIRGFSFDIRADVVTLTSTTKKISGKKGDRAEINMVAQRGWTDLDLTSDDIKINIGRGDLLTLVEKKKDSIIVEFAKEITTGAENVYVKFSVTQVSSNKTSNEIEVQLLQTSTEPVPTISDVQVVDCVIYDEGLPPFKVKTSTGVDITDSVRIQSIMHAGGTKQYLEVIESNTKWRIKNADIPGPTKEQYDFTFTAVANGVTFNMSQRVLFNIAAYDGKDIVIEGLEDSYIGLNGEDGKFTYQPYYLGKPAAGKVTLDTGRSDWKGLITILGQTHDEATNTTTVTYRPLKSDYSENVVMQFRPVGNTGSVVNKDYVNITRHFTIEDPKLVVVGSPNGPFRGPLNSMHFIAFTIKRRGIIYPANDPRVTVGYAGGTSNRTMKEMAKTDKGIWYAISNGTAPGNINDIFFTVEGERVTVRFEFVRTSDTGAVTYNFTPLTEIIPGEKNTASIRVKDGSGYGTLSLLGVTITRDPWSNGNAVIDHGEWSRVGLQQDTFQIPMDNGHTGTGFRVGGVVIDEKGAAYVLNESIYPVPQSPIITAATPTTISNINGVKTTVSVTMKQKRFNRVVTDLVGATFSNIKVVANGRLIGEPVANATPGTYDFVLEGVGTEGNVQVNGSIIHESVTYPFSFVVRAEAPPRPDTEITAKLVGDGILTPNEFQDVMFDLTDQHDTPIEGATKVQMTIKGSRNSVLGTYSNTVSPVEGAPGRYKLSLTAAHRDGTIDITMTVNYQNFDYVLNKMTVTNPGAPVRLVKDTSGLVSNYWQPVKFHFVQDRRNEPNHVIVGKSVTITPVQAIGADAVVADGDKWNTKLKATGAVASKAIAKFSIVESVNSLDELYETTPVNTEFDVVSALDLKLEKFTPEAEALVGEFVPFDYVITSGGVDVSSQVSAVSIYEGASPVLHIESRNGKWGVVDTAGSTSGNIVKNMVIEFWVTTTNGQVGRVTGPFKLTVIKNNQMDFKVRVIQPESIHVKHGDKGVMEFVFMYRGQYLTDLTDVTIVNETKPAGFSTAGLTWTPVGATRPWAAVGIQDEKAWNFGIKYTPKGYNSTENVGFWTSVANNLKLKAGSYGEPINGTVGTAVIAKAKFIWNGLELATNEGVTYTIDDTTNFDLIGAANDGANIRPKTAGKFTLKITGTRGGASDSWTVEVTTVAPPALELNDNFATKGNGDEFNPLTLNQSVVLTNE